MSSISELFTPASVKDVPLRPLSKGIRRDVSSSEIDTGEFYDLSNLLARKDGLWRRKAFLDYLNGAVIIHPPVTSMDSIWKSDGTQTSTLLDSRMLYSISSSYTLAKFVYSTGDLTGTVTGGITRLTGNGTLWATAASDIKVGDILYCADLTGTAKLGVIKAIGSDTQIDLETNEGTAAGGSSYEVRRAIWGKSGHFPDLLSLNGKLLIADGRRNLRAYDPISSATAYAYYSADSTFNLVPSCLAFFKDRLFLGRTLETGGTVEWRSRTRWTTTLDLTVLPALQFVDKPETSGFLRRLVPLKDSLIMYMSDAIWIGRTTNYGDALPVAFDTRLETGGIGLVGDRAICSFMGGHFFVGDDNIYFLGPGMDRPEEIGGPIRDIFFTDPERLWSCRVDADPSNTRILFTEPSLSQGFSKIFSFDYQAKAWSYEEVSGTYLGRKQINRGVTYDTILTGAPYTYDTGLGVYPSYDAIGTSEIARMYIGFGSGVRYYAEVTATEDGGTEVIPVRVESGDFDYGEPEKQRVHHRLSLRLKAPIAEDLTFVVKVSTDEGLTWKTTSGRSLTIPAGQVKNYVNFRAKGSKFRFRLESVSVCGSYTIQEIVMRASGAGVEAHLEANR